MAKNSLRQYDPVTANNTDLNGYALGNTTKPSDVEKFTRGGMANIAQWLAEMSFPAAGGSANALTLTPTTALAALVSNQVYTFTVTAANTGAATLAVSGLAAKAIRRIQGGTDGDLSAGELQVGDRVTVVYDTAANGSSGAWVIAARSVAVNTPGLRNKLINGNFGINQRAVSGTVTLSAGVYGHDGWKAGASGCTYTFATSANVTTLTISAGSLQQVVEGINLSSGTHTLSWGGTAQGKIGAGSYSASGVTGTATGGTNLTVEFGTGTLSVPQLEFGSTASAFEQRSIQQELAFCQRYFYRAPIGQIITTVGSGGSIALLIQFPVPMRATATFAAGSLTDANFAGTSTPTGTQWAMQSDGLAVTTKTGTFTVGASGAVQGGLIAIFGGTLSNTPNVALFGPSFVMPSFSAEL